MDRVRLSPWELNKGTFVNSHAGSLRQAITYKYIFKSKKQLQDGVRIGSSLQQYLICPLGRRRSVTRGTWQCFVNHEDAGPLGQALLHFQCAWTLLPLPSGDLAGLWDPAPVASAHIPVLLFLLQDIFSVYCYIFLIIIKVIKCPGYKKMQTALWGIRWKGEVFLFQASQASPCISSFPEANSLFLPYSPGHETASACKGPALPHSGKLPCIGNLTRCLWGWKEYTPLAPQHRSLSPPAHLWAARRPASAGCLTLLPIPHHWGGSRRGASWRCACKGVADWGGWQLFLKCQ